MVSLFTFLIWQSAELQKMAGEFYARRAGEQMEQKALMEAEAAVTSQEFYTTLPYIFPNTPKEKCQKFRSKIT